tara:strand:- start:220 stop:723 length:504 start_codon:yes stop_codon:yes gene_type:complete
MKKTYQIYVASDQATDPTATNNVKEYKFDWSIIPEGEYEMTFSVISKAVKLPESSSVTENNPVKVQFDVPFMTDRYEVNKATGYAGSSNVAGFISFYDSPITSNIMTPEANRRHLLRQYRAVYSDNAPVIVRGKPSGNSFIVRFLRSNNQVATMYEYVLVINFKSLC